MTASVKALRGTNAPSSKRHDQIDDEEDTYDVPWEFGQASRLLSSTAPANAGSSQLRRRQQEAVDESSPLAQRCSSSADGASTSAAPSALSIARRIAAGCAAEQATERRVDQKQPQKLFTSKGAKVLSPPPQQRRVADSTPAAPARMGNAAVACVVPAQGRDEGVPPMAERVHAINSLTKREFLRTLQKRPPCGVAAASQQRRARREDDENSPLPSLKQRPTASDEARTNVGRFNPPVQRSKTPDAVWQSSEVVSGEVLANDGVYDSPWESKTLGRYDFRQRKSVPDGRVKSNSERSSDEFAPKGVVSQRVKLFSGGSTNTATTVDRTLLSEQSCADVEEGQYDEPWDLKRKKQRPTAARAGDRVQGALDVSVDSGHQSSNSSSLSSSSGGSAKRITAARERDATPVFETAFCAIRKPAAVPKRRPRDECEDENERRIQAVCFANDGVVGPALTNERLHFPSTDAPVARHAIAANDRPVVPSCDSARPKPAVRKSKQQLQNGAAAATVASAHDSGNAMTAAVCDVASPAVPSARRSPPPSAAGSAFGQRASATPVPTDFCDEEYDTPWDLHRSRTKVSTGAELLQDCARSKVVEGGSSSPVPSPSSTPVAKKFNRAKLSLNFGCAGLNPVAQKVDTEIDVEKQVWFHGAISRVESEERLANTKEGSYLVRVCEGNKDEYALSLKSAKGFMHMKIQRAAAGDDAKVSKKWVLGYFSQPFECIPKMIRYYSVNKLPIKGAEHMCLLFPVPEQLL